MRSWLVLSAVLLSAAVLPREGLASGKARITFSADSTSTIRDGESWTKIYSGNVVIKHGDTVLRSSRAIYSERDQKVELSGDVTIKDSLRTVSSDVAYYFIREKRALLRGNVRLRSGDRGIDASWIDYSRETGDIVAVGNVELFDSAEGIVATGGRVLYNEREQVGELFALPKLTKGDGEEGYQMEITGRTLRVHMKSKEVHAIGDVEITKGSWNAYCDSATYFYDEGRLILRGDPRMVQKSASRADGGGELSGDLIEIHLDGYKISELRVEGNAKAKSFSTSEGERATSEVSGNSILMKFRDEEIEEMVVGGNATSIYTVSSSGGKPRSSWASSDSMYFSIADGRISHVILRGGVVGTYHTESGSGEEKEGTR